MIDTSRLTHLTFIIKDLDCMFLFSFFPYFKDINLSTFPSSNRNGSKEADNTAQPATTTTTTSSGHHSSTSLINKESSTSGVTNLDKLTRTELRSYKLIRIE